MARLSVRSGWKLSKIKAQRTFSTLFLPDTVLSPANINRTISKFGQMKLVREPPVKPTKRAAVLIPLCVVDGQMSLLYTLRAANLKSHRGQVSFPGGMQDSQDQNLEETALRETEEELGLSRERIILWGSGNAIVSRGEICVVPIIGQIQNELSVLDLRVNPTEVGDVFTVSLENLCDSNKNRYTQFRGTFSMPVFLGGKQRIWGLTAAITNLFLTALLPEQAYTPCMKYVFLGNNPCLGR